MIQSCGRIGLGVMRTWSGVLYRVLIQSLLVPYDIRHGFSFLFFCIRRLHSSPYYCQTVRMYLAESVRVCERKLVTHAAVESS